MEMTKETIEVLNEANEKAVEIQEQIAKAEEKKRKRNAVLSVAAGGLLAVGATILGGMRG